MCRAVVEQGGEEVAEGINSGIVYLMAFPYMLVTVAFYLFYRSWKRSNLQ
jgi:predicted RND superfamily exporter protein